MDGWFSCFVLDRLVGHAVSLSCRDSILRSVIESEMARGCILRLGEVSRGGKFWIVFLKCQRGFKKTREGFIAWKFGDEMRFAAAKMLGFQ